VASARTELAVGQALRFLRARWLVVGVISAVLLIPCFWHQHIEAGDLASHTYNAWLAQLIERGQAPGLYFAHPWTNILADVALARLGNDVGFAVAEKIVVSVSVLIFFWGAFALIGAATRQPPWFPIPLIAMLAYGWTFEMGFLNYYLSLGLGFFALALIWRGRGLDWLLGVLLAGLTLLAHPMGFLCLAAVAAYIKLAEKLSGAYRWGTFAAAFLAVFAFHYYIVRHFTCGYWYTFLFCVMNGTDQLVLFGAPYVGLAIATILFASLCFLAAAESKPEHRGEGKGALLYASFRTPLELWALLLFTAAMIPELIRLPQYAAPVGFPVSRLTSITAVMELCLLGCVRPRKWHLAGFSAIAALFFTLLFIDTSTLNGMEKQADDLVRALPYGRRVTETLVAPRGWRVPFINHIVDHACIGHCFSYSNYEPSSGQFRIHARPGSPLVTSSTDASQAMEQGEYVVKPEDLPMMQIYQCDKKDWTRLCLRDLSAGENNGRIRPWQ
jgi:hypothetical protein